MSRHECQLHRSEIGQAYSHTVTASLSDLSTIYTVLRSANGLCIPLKDAVESYYWQLPAIAVKCRLNLHVAAVRRQVKSGTLGSYGSHQQSHVMLWHKLPHYQSVTTLAVTASCTDLGLSTIRAIWSTAYYVHLERNWHVIVQHLQSGALRRKVHLISRANPTRSARPFCTSNASAPAQLGKSTVRLSNPFLSKSNCHNSATYGSMPINTESHALHVMSCKPCDCDKEPEAAAGPAYCSEVAAALRSVAEQNTCTSRAPLSCAATLTRPARWDIRLCSA